MDIPTRAKIGGLKYEGEPDSDFFTDFDLFLL